MYFFFRMGCCYSKEEIDNRNTSKIEKIFFIYIITFASLLAYSSYHFSINLDIERLQFCKVFKRICRFLFKFAEKEVFEEKYRGIKRNEFRSFFTIYMCKISLPFRLVKCFRRKMFRIHHNEHLLHRSAFHI